MPKQQRVMEGSSGGRSYEDMLRSAKPAESAFEGVGGLTQRSAQRELKRLEDGDPKALERRREYYEQQQQTQDKLAKAKVSGMKKGGAVKYKPKAKAKVKTNRGDGIAQRGKTKGRFV